MSVHVGNSNQSTAGVLATFQRSPNVDAPTYHPMGHEKTYLASNLWHTFVSFIVMPSTAVRAADGWTSPTVFQHVGSPVEGNVTLTASRKSTAAPTSGLPKDSIHWSCNANTGLINPKR